MSVHIDPFETGHVAYYDIIVAFNKSVQHDVALLLRKELAGRKDRFAIYTSGSDARFEKGPVSPVELVIVVDDTQKGEGLSIDLSRIVRLHDPGIYERGFEVRNVEAQQIWECQMYEGGQHTYTMFSPNRLLDALYLFGDGSLNQQLRARMVENLTSPRGKSAIKRIKKKFLDHKLVTATGGQVFKGRPLTHYDLNEGCVFYDDDQIGSFKQGPLRMVQFALVRDTLKAIRTSPDHADIFFNIHYNTVGKLYDLMVHGLTPLTSGQIDDLSDGYKFFTWLYHKSQQAFFEDGAERMLTFDVAEARERITDMVAITSGKLIKY